MYYHGGISRAGKTKQSTYPRLPKQDKRKKKTGRAKKRKLYNKRIIENKSVIDKKISDCYQRLHTGTIHRKDYESITVTHEVSQNKSCESLKITQNQKQSILVMTSRHSLCTKKMWTYKPIYQMGFCHVKTMMRSKIRGKKFGVNGKQLQQERKWKSQNIIKYMFTGTLQYKL